MTRPPSSPPPLSLGVRLGYALGAVAFGIGASTLAAQTLQLYFNQVLGAPAVWVGTAVMISLVLDAFFDPLVGRWSDNLRSPLGRRHTFMYASALPAGLGLFLMWHAPESLGGLGLFAFMAGMLLLVRMACSLFEIPSLALVPELAPTYEDRTTLFAWRWMFLVMGGALCNGVLYRIFLRQDAANPLGALNRDRYSQFGIFIALLIFVVIIVSSAATHRRISQFHVPPPRRLTFRQTLGEVATTFRHRLLAVLMATNLLIHVGGGMTVALTAYLYLHFWGLKPQDFAVILFLGPFASFLSLAGAPALAKRLGKKPAVFVFYATWILTATVPLILGLFHILPGPGPVLVAILTAVSFVSSGSAVGVHVVLYSMLSDATEDVAVKTGQRSEGVMFAAYVFMQKFGDGLGAFCAGLLLTLVRFPAKAIPGTVDPQIIQTLVLALLAVIIVFNLAAIACVSLYRLSREQHEANLTELRRREGLAAQAELDPAQSGAAVLLAAAD